LDAPLLAIAQVTPGRAIVPYNDDESETSCTMPIPRHRQLRRETMLKPLLLLPAVLFVAVGMSPIPQKPAKPAPAAATPEEPKPDPAAKAKEVYNRDCAICHNANGDGKSDLGKSMGVTSDWTDPKTLQGKSDQEIFDLIRKGKGNNMPAEDSGRAKDEEVKGLVKYLREFSKGQPAPAAEPAAAPAASNPPSAN
jgi:cytochrome c5